MSERLSAGMLLSTTDASVWAREFCAIAEGLGHQGIDEGWMIGWFANAMAAQEMAMTSQVRPADFRHPDQTNPHSPQEGEALPDSPTDETIAKAVQSVEEEAAADLKGHSQNYGEPGSIAHMLANGSAEQTE